jgi:hypothetical protein
MLELRLSLQLVDYLIDDVLWYQVCALYFSAGSVIAS